MRQQKKVSIHAYKWNGWLYRVWEFPKILKETDEFICVSSQNCRVITSEDGSDRYFHSKISKPTIWYFFKKEWLNIIITEKNDKFSFYINLASPILYEKDTIKYIDFDLDYTVNDISKNVYKELDFKEYTENSIRFDYPKELKAKIEETKQIIINNLREKKYNTYFEKSPLSKKEAK